jgi:hypothetical protein
MFGILSEDRFSHLYVIGKTGAGKSTLLENMAIQDLEHGNGFALIDPHGELADRIASRIPMSRQSDVIYLDASDPSQPYGYNPLRHVREDRIALAASGFLEVFKKMWPEAWGVRMEHILRNILMALLERPNSTMHDIVRVITDQKFRTEIARSVRNESVKRFFEKEYGGFSFGYRSDGTAPIHNPKPSWCGELLLPPLRPLPVLPLRPLPVPPLRTWPRERWHPPRRQRRPLPCAR